MQREPLYQDGNTRSAARPHRGRIAVLLACVIGLLLISSLLGRGFVAAGRASGPVTVADGSRSSRTMENELRATLNAGTPAERRDLAPTSAPASQPTPLPTTAPVHGSDDSS